MEGFADACWQELAPLRQRFSACLLSFYCNVLIMCAGYGARPAAPMQPYGAPPAQYGVPPQQAAQNPAVANNPFSALQRPPPRYY